MHNWNILDCGHNVFKRPISMVAKVLSAATGPSIPTHVDTIKL